MILENIISQESKGGMIMFFSGMQRNIKVFYKLILSFWACVARSIMSKVPKIRNLHIFTLFPENMGYEVDFMPADKYESFLQIDVSFWMCVARLAQSTKNNNFATSLQYLKEIILCFFLQINIQDFFKLILSF